LYAAKRLEAKIRSASQNWSKPVFYLKCDLANFFVAIDKQVLRRQLAAKITEPWWLALAEQILMHDPREDYEVRSAAHLFNRVPQHKRLTAQPAHLGLPIGNLSSQFFANVYLDARSAPSIMSATSMTSCSCMSRRNSSTPGWRRSKPSFPAWAPS
jgi:hypothetical protein